MTACQICGGRDVVEEFLAAKIWPLSAGWAPLRFERKRFAGLEYDMTSPVFGLRKPEGSSDEVIVAELSERLRRYWALGIGRSMLPWLRCVARTFG